MNKQHKSLNLSMSSSVQVRALFCTCTLNLLQKVCQCVFQIWFMFTPTLSCFHPTEKCSQKCDATSLLVHLRAGGLPKQDNRVRDPKAGGSNLSLPQCTPPDGSTLVLTVMSPWGLQHIARQHDLMIMTGVISSQFKAIQE